MVYRQLWESIFWVFHSVCSISWPTTMLKPWAKMLEWSPNKFILEPRKKCKTVSSTMVPPAQRKSSHSPTLKRQVGVKVSSNECLVGWLNGWKLNDQALKIKWDENPCQSMGIKRGGKTFRRPREYFRKLYTRIPVGERGGHPAHLIPPPSIWH